MIHTYTYPTEGYNPIFKGMPEFNEEFHPCREDFPLCCSILLKIQYIPMYHIIHGKTYDLIPQDFRQYEFKLSGTVKEGWGLMHLYIKEKKAFFKTQKDFKLMHNGLWQRIPLTYSTLSKMTEEELFIIYNDFD